MTAKNVLLFRYTTEEIVIYYDKKQVGELGCDNIAKFVFKMSQEK